MGLSKLMLPHGYQMDEDKIKEIEVIEQETIDYLPKQRLSKIKRMGKLGLDLLERDLKEGAINPLDVKITVKYLESLISSLKRNTLDDLALEESTKYGKTFEYLGTTITRSEGAARFNYAGCQEIVDLEAQLKNRKEVYKKAYEFVVEGTGVATTEEVNGELVQCWIDENGQSLRLPEKNYSKASLRIK